MASAPDLVFLLLVSTDAIDVMTAVRVVKAVLGELRSLAPEEAADVGAVLRTDLRELWESAAQV